MDLPTPKQIAALAKACRKAGISTFKGAGIEFTLEPTTTPAKRHTKAAAAPVDVSDDPVETEEPSQDDLLYWSAGSSDEAPPQ